jgi:CheY-like chemotaxis protein
MVARHSQPAERLHPATPTDTGSFTLAELAGITVLVVDDQADARDLVRRLLEACSATVLTTADADEALRLVREHRPHVFVSDIGMPQTDGFELLRRVRALGPEQGGRVPAIALTAFARSEDRIRALRAGFVVHVAKPVDPSELVATVASVAGRLRDG